MTPQALLAENLAHAALSGPADMDSLCTRCRRVLGGKPAWLDGLLRHLIAQHVTAWNASSHDALRRDILQYRELRIALGARSPPRVRSLALDPAHMVPSRFGRTGAGLPALPTPGDLARWLAIDLNDLRWLADLRGGFRDDPPAKASHYRYCWVPKRSGGFRLLEIPKPRLREIQRRVLHEILDYLPPHNAAHGFRTGRSTLSNAVRHVGKRVVVRLDLRDFFLGIRANRVRGLFKAMGYPIAAANVLTGLCTTGVPAYALRSADEVGRYAFELPSLGWGDRQPFLAAHLPQGAPTSPALANLCAFGLDARLQAFARALGAEYTRYADDLVFSGDDELNRAADRLPARIGAIALEEGFAVNHRKTRIMRRSQRQSVTGIVVNESPNLAREEFDRIKAMLHNARGKDLTDQWRARMLGHVAQAERLNPGRGARLRRMLLAVSGVA